MTDKARRIADWVEDIREIIGNVRSDMGTLPNPSSGKTENRSVLSSKA